MSRAREILLSPLFLIAEEILFAAAIAVGVIFYPRADLIETAYWKVLLIEISFVICNGALLTFAYLQKRPDASWLFLLRPFLIGCLIFASIFYGWKMILFYLHPALCAFVVVAIASAFAVACVIAGNVFAVKRDRKYFVWVTAPVALAAYVGFFLLSCSMLPHGFLLKAFSRRTHTFCSESAEAYALTDADRAAGRAFFEERLAADPAAGQGSAFDFSVGGLSFRSSSAGWISEVEQRVDDEDGIALIKTYTKKSSGICARLVAFYYAQTATLEWTVYLTNVGRERSETVSDFYALDATLPVRSPTLYFSGGSAESKEDFALYSRRLTSRKCVFDTVKGRSSQLYLPFFNLSGKAGGATIGVGWSGEWTASFSANKDASVRIGQSRLEGYLEPGETVRSPLVSLCLYSGDNPLKGFNAFRADIKRALPEQYATNTFLMFGGAEGQDDTSRASEAGAREYIDKLNELGLTSALDYAWYDAGWYDTHGTGDWRGSVGDWQADEEKYPDGFGAVSDYLAANGVKTLLWYEPERVPVTSALYREIRSSAGRESWLISVDEGDCLWNMGNDDARAFMIDRIASSLVENGVSYYRQDFNIDPERYWEKADELYYGGRKGFAENQYVSGEYEFLDALASRVPGLLIDNCASGGKRIDLEMCRRSVPLWRSDYQCRKDEPDLSEAAQAQLYGLSLWLPYSSVTNPNARSEYDFRSVLGGSVMCYGDVLFDAPTEYAAFLRDYEKVKRYFDENYYPLDRPGRYGYSGVMQFGNEKEGMILLYSQGSRTNVFYPNGLLSDKKYSLSTIEGEAIEGGFGADLMTNGFKFKTEEKKAHIILYRED